MTEVEAKTENKRTIKCWVAATPGSELKLQEFESAPLQPDEVEVEIFSSGICASDIGCLNEPRCKFPMVAGHEGIGKVTAIGSLVRTLSVGTVVGLGVYRDACGSCLMCSTGKNNLCDKKELMFVAGGKGTFSSHVRIKAAYAFRIPDAFKDKYDMVGPLMCAGVTTFAPFKAHKVKPGQKVAIFGIGGLGHLSIKFARAWGCEVTALTSSIEKKDSILQLGAHRVVDMKQDPELKNCVGAFDYVMATMSGGDVNWGALIKSLAKDGKLIVMGFSSAKPEIPVNLEAIIMGQKHVCGSASGSSGDVVEMLQFAALHNIVPQVVKFPFSQINEALKQVNDKKVNYRAVLYHPVP